MSFTLERVAQLVEQLAHKSKGRGIEAHHNNGILIFADIAQLVERALSKRKVAGSIPVVGFSSYGAIGLACMITNHEVPGSSPGRSSYYFLL